MCEMLSTAQGGSAWLPVLTGLLLLLPRPHGILGGKEMGIRAVSVLSFL